MACLPHHLHGMTGQFFRIALAAIFTLLLAAPAAAQHLRPHTHHEFTQDYEPSPAIWQVSDEDTTVYLLGTMHALPRGFRWRSAKLNAIIAEADELVVETSRFDPSADVLNVDAKLKARIANRSSTSSRLSAAGRERWIALIATTGFGCDEIDKLPILLGLLTMGMMGEADDQSFEAYGVESVLEQEFLRRELPIIAIEDSGEVMYSLFRLDTAALVDDLDSKLMAWNGKSLMPFFDVGYVERSADDYWRMEHRWAQGILEADFSIGFGDGPIGRAFDYNLLDRRNTSWARWIEMRLQDPGTALVAVGAGHFEGPASLLIKLDDRGLSANRID